MTPRNMLADHTSPEKLPWTLIVRRLPRRMGFMALALVVLSFVFVQSFTSTPSDGMGRLSRGKSDPVQVAAADKELINVLVKHKEAMDVVDPPVEDIAGYADRFIVLQELDALAASLPTRYPRINASKHETYRRSLEYHHQTLFAHLFPYISRSSNSPRTLSQLRAGYTQKEGIIIPCGRDQFQYAVHLIATLKHVHKTTLPIQVVHAGNDDLPPDRRAALRSIAPDVETVDVLHFFDEEYVGLQGGGWAIKAFAILASTFERVIICDADAVFFQDPRVLFDDPGYNETGTLYFRDREIFPGDGNVHEWWHKTMEGRKPSAEMEKSRFWQSKASREEQESGVVVFDKGRKQVLMGLIYVGYLNTKRVREPVTYQYTYGDKESFWMGFELGQIPYHFDVPYASIIGQLTHPDHKAHSIASQICSDHLFHLDHKGRPLWFNGSLFQEKRVKDNGWFLATHWAYGTVMWECDPEPWCMVGIGERDVFKLGAEETSILQHMIGTCIFWETQFPGLVDKHY
ncbi:alpha-mannosyltransferase, glycosyltransferase family 71 protein [Pseudohyphozyma bogoriensis]|nr:alpha-mannosyltransferase, glycosyltransferase family 71 protein [Pseudohyphozyma bogoriensis]